MGEIHVKPQQLSIATTLLSLLVREKPLCYIYDKNRYVPSMDEIITVEPYEWLIYIYSGSALTVVGFIFLIVLVLTDTGGADKVIPGMIAAMVCFITSLYFFSEGHAIKEEQMMSTDLDLTGK